MNLFICAVSSIHSQHAIRESIIKLPYPTVSSTQQRCCICKDVKGREAIPKTALVDLFLKRKIFLPKSNRTCGKHIVDGIFTSAALELIEPTQESLQLLGIYLQPLKCLFECFVNFLKMFRRACCTMVQ